LFGFLTSQDCIICYGRSVASDSGPHRTLSLGPLCTPPLPHPQLPFPPNQKFFFSLVREFVNMFSLSLISSTKPWYDQRRWRVFVPWDHFSCLTISYKPSQPHTIYGRAGCPLRGPGILLPGQFYNLKCPYVHFRVQMWHRNKLNFYQK
jgi:hypothetical protein